MAEGKARWREIKWDEENLAEKNIAAGHGDVVRSCAEPVGIEWWRHQRQTAGL